jgi:hypothetical protein
VVLGMLAELNRSARQELWRPVRAGHPYLRGTGGPEHRFVGLQLVAGVGQSPDRLPTARRSGERSGVLRQARGVLVLGKSWEGLCLFR